MNTNRGLLKAGILVSAVGAMASGCAKMGTEGSSVMQALLGGGAAGPQYGVCISNVDGSGKPVSPPLYCDNSGSALRLVDSKNYVLSINSSSSGSFQYEVSMERVDVVTVGMVAPQIMNAGNNPLTAPAPGDYVIKIGAVSGSTRYPVKLLQSSVACDVPAPLSASNLNSSAISVSGAGLDNLYNFSASGIDSGAPGGQGPYLCAFDFNGDGTRDSVFKPCSEGFSNIYVNYVGNRNIGVIVKDNCNSAASVSKSLNLALQGLPSRQPGDKSIFIHGQTSNAAGTAAGSAATNNVNYWATNTAQGGGEKPVLPNFTYNGANSSFVMLGSYSYGLPSSLKFGVKLTVSGVPAVLGADAASTTICGQTGPLGNAINNFNCPASVKLNRIDYTTDQAGDAQAPLSLSGNLCTSQIGAEVLDVQGEPCYPGSTTNLTRKTSYTIHMYGRYSCDPLTGSGGSMKVDGEFDGLAFLVDACVGGGGGGGGGIVPIGF